VGGGKEGAITFAIGGGGAGCKPVGGGKLLTTGCDLFLELELFLGFDCGAFLLEVVVGADLVEGLILLTAFSVVFPIVLPAVLPAVRDILLAKALAA
jgi:hypothetical protein